MDPMTALQDFCQAMQAHDREGVALAANALVGWIEKGGYLPAGPYDPPWIGQLTRDQIASYFRAVRHIAEMT